MIVYLDASSLVKLFAAEPGSDQVRALVAEAELNATSALAYPEIRSAFARWRREGLVTAEKVAELSADLDRDWSTYLVLEVTPAIWRSAGDLTDRHALRALDSLHLASFLHLRSEDLGSPVRFSSFDDRLNLAAQAEAGPVGPPLRE